MSSWSGNEAGFASVDEDVLPQKTQRRRRVVLSCSNSFGDDVLDKCSQRRRRVARLAHAEGEQREAGSVGKLANWNRAP